MSKQAYVRALSEPGGDGPGCPGARWHATIDDVLHHAYEFFYGYRRSVPVAAG